MTKIVRQTGVMELETIYKKGGESKKLNVRDRENFIAKKLSLLFILSIAITVFNSCKGNEDQQGNDSGMTGITTNDGVVINGVTWATCNLAAKGNFTVSPEDYGNLYTWEEAQNACPQGWRLPTNTELQSLIDAGCTWIAENGVSGPVWDSGSSTLFLPMAGYRSDGTTYRDEGNYWSSDHSMLFFTERVTPPIIRISSLSSAYDAMGRSIRCVKDGSSGNNGNNGSNSVVYVAGTIHSSSTTVAILWKNGVAQKLSDGTNNAEAYSVYVSGNDVYVAGSDGKVATLWKNGVAQKLTDGTNNAYACSVYVYGNDVYVTGLDDAYATLWKNGIKQKLTQDTNTDAVTSSVYVTGNNVYVAGAEAYPVGTGTGWISIAILWKNGVAQKLTDETSYSIAGWVYVSGNDVYVTGNEETLDFTTCTAKLWKNGVAKNLTDGTEWSKAGLGYVSGNDVYVAGTIYSSDTTKIAILWKNGIAQKLSDGTNDAGAYSVYVSGNDVYVAGGDGKVATLWKNGVPQKLSDGTNYASANSVFVK